MYFPRKTTEHQQGGPSLEPPVTSLELLSNFDPLGEGLEEFFFFIKGVEVETGQTTGPKLKGMRIFLRNRFVSCRVC
jgi:hypothetical protein